MSITITDAAVRHIVHCGQPLRIRIKSGGCSGLRTLFTFDTVTHDTDVMIENGKAQVVIDPLSLSFVQGSTLYYKNEMMESHFVLTHPNAASTCGCGESFAL